MEFFTFIVLAILVETVIEYFKQIPAFKNCTAAILIVSAVLGILVCFVTGADILAELGFNETIPYVGTALTGIAVGGGSNIVFDIIKRIRGAKEQLRVLERPEGDPIDHEDKGVG